MFNAVVDRLVSVLSPASADRSGVPRLVAIAVLAALSWGVLAAIVLAGVWAFRFVTGS